MVACVIITPLSFPYFGATAYHLTAKILSPYMMIKFSSYFNTILYIRKALFYCIAGKFSFCTVKKYFSQKDRDVIK